MPMISADIRSQLDLSTPASRFRGSAPEREWVKEQLALGMSPVDIEREGRVERRIEHLGFTRPEASSLAREARSVTLGSGPRAASGRRRIGLERIIGRDELVSSTFLERGAAAASSVCCVRLGSARIGTGFLVAPRLMMTNAHVIRSREEASGCSAEFDYEDSRDGNGTGPSIAFDLAPEELFVSSPVEELDYVLVAVKAKSGTRDLKEFGFLRLNPSVGKVLRGESLNIIQHPEGAPKRVALRQNRFTALLDSFMHYETDTMPGSSGSPVFNDQWQVVCLHHSGVPLTDAEGNILTKDNRIWNEEDDDPELIKWIGNEGVRISRIVADVAGRVGSNRSKLLADFPKPADNPSHDEEEIVGGYDDQNGRSGRQKSDVELHSGRRITPRDDSPSPATGRTTISIPLTLTLTIGDQGHSYSLALSDAEPVRSEPEQGNLVERGLRNLERSRTRTYYDADRDATARSTYYEDVDPESASLGETLRRLITDTHTTRLTYRVARIQHLYAWVDLQREKNLRSIYSDERFDPGRFIREDFVLERRIERLVERRQAREESNLPAAALEQMIASLEAQEVFNCEHVVPQSWFDEHAPMQGDLHHLFACQSQCNSFRGNKPYHDFHKFPIAREANRPSCGFSDDGLFEPFMGKGKVARATLYFLTRYPGQFENMYEDLDDGIATLLDWHEQSPVTEHERHRNQAIQEIQGNRNPFIDHPDWARRAFEG